MLRLKTIYRLAAFGVALSFFPVIAEPAVGDCAPFPSVRWWGELSHQSVIRYVKARHEGDWAPYIGKWENQLAKIEGVYSRGKTILVSKDKIKVAGEALGAYLEQLRKRLEVTRCLSRNGAQAAVSGDKSNDLLDLKIDVKCEKGTAVFKLVNNGGKWLKLGAIQIYRVDGKKVISQRRLRLAKGQTSSFKARAEDGGEVGLWVEPSWYRRKFDYDAKIACG